MFGFEAYHILLAALGGSIILAFWLPRFVSGREPATSALLILAGLGAFTLVPGMPLPLDPVKSPRAWEVASEICVIVGLFGTGLRIDRLAARAQWVPTLRLLAIAMPLCILLIALFGWVLAGMTLAGGLLLGAILAPTDPVLASDVQVGPPQEGGEHLVRYTLTTEAGLNDGLAFPFVHLGIAVAMASGVTGGLIAEWFAVDVVYRIAVGAASGAGTGWLLGKILFDCPRENSLSKTESGVIALAGVLLAYGITEIAEGYGFIAAFVAGVSLRRSETHHEFHRRLHDFSQSLEHALTAVLLVGLGAMLPVLWPHFDPANAAIGALLIFVVRPATGWLSLARSGLVGRERLVVAFYGVRGIGSIYYLAYAGHHVKLVDEYQLWATIAFTIFLSTIVHGLTAGLALDGITDDEKHPPDVQPAASSREGG
ncbi:cation:proton antiporter [Allosphingosinicella deserti]|uniref:Sodium:proton antiporter n=1 Tax=Allosphingosinicella deserti TaxID=2116704 RepID=A0A2P7QGH5_9SPHN|nr:cation:proton antiporter [Sphingomonas deserti]PSJ37016.1 sodium:proton antiporter [Sphingomonas deserti]